MKKMKILLTFLGIVLSFQIYGQNTDKDTKKWTFKECVLYALENNISIKEAELTKNTSEVNYAKTKSVRLPDLTGSASQSFSNGNTVDPITSDYVSQQINSTNLSLNSSVTLFQGNQLNNQIKQSKLLINQNSLYLQESKNNITLSILEAYVQTLYSKEGIQIAENNLIASEKEVERAKARLDAGSITLSDYTDAVSQASTNKYNLINAKNSYAQQLLTLKQLLELTPATNFDIVQVANENYSSEIIPNKLEVYQNALNNLPEVKAGLLNVEISEKELEIAKGGYLPSLSLSASLGSGYTSSNDLNFGDQMDVNFNQRVGLSLSVPIFNRNQTKTEVQNAKINIDKAKLQQESIKKELYKKIETAWQNALSSKEQLKAAEDARNAAKESYKLAQKKYELNALSTTDLVISQNTYTNAEQNYIQAKYLNILYSQLLQFYQGKDIKLQ